MNTFKAYIKKLYSIIKKPEMEILPGHLAFFLVLSIIPLILMFVALASRFSVSVDLITNFINDVLPKEVGTILVPYFTTGVDFNAILFMVMGFVLASNGLYSVIVSANTLYSNNKGSYLKRRIKSFVLTFMLLFLFVFMVVVMAFGDNLMLVFKETLDIDLIYQYFYMVYLIIKWPFAIMYIFFVINLIYTIAPDDKVKSKSVFKGSFFTTISWMLVTYGYSYYAANFAKYDFIYGSLSSIVVMMIWIYILSYLFIIGMAINVSKYNQEEKMEVI